MPVHYNSRALRIVTLSTPVATNALQAAGMALSLKERGIPEVVIASIGDASSREGEFYEALAMAAADQLPVVFVIEDNGYGISTPTAGRTFWKMKHGVTENSDGSWFHGCPVLRVDGLDPESVYETTLSAIDQARSGAGPTILIANVERLKSHSSSDAQRIYRSADELEHLRDPVKLYMQRCLDRGIVDQRAIAVMRQELHDQVNEAARQAIGEGEPDPRQEIDSVFAPLPLSLCNAVEKLPSPLSKDEGGRTMAQCIELVLEQEMKGNDRIYLYGEDIEDPKGDVFGITRGLSGKFPGHVRNSPLAEATIVGSSVGRALAGDLPVAAIQFIDFVGPALNQLFNEVITIYWRSAGQWNCPILILSPYGAYAPGIGPWHSQTNEALFAHMPGLHVVIPSSPADAAGLLRFSLRCQRPVLFLYPKRLLHTAENTVEIPPEDCMVPFGHASVLRRGKDVTLVTWGNCVSICLSAASAAHADGIECEIIDLRTIIPWDRDAVLKSVRNTGRLIVVHEDARTCGFGSEIVAEVVAECFDSLISPPARVTKGDVHNPYNIRLQLAALPSVEQTMAVVRSLCQRQSTPAKRKEKIPESPATTSDTENVVDILVPQQSPTDEDAHLICFRVQHGDDVAEGAVVAEMEANKGAFEIESTHSGRVIALHGSPGSRMLIGEKLLTLEVSSHNTKSQTSADREPGHHEQANKERAEEPKSAIVKLSPAQIRVSRIARISLRDIPQSSVECDADVTNLVDRRDHSPRKSENGQERNHPGITHSILWAMVHAMKEERHRLFRGRLSEDEQSVLIGEGIHVGLAVLGPGDDLVVPVIRDAQNLDLTELTAYARALQQKVQAGNIAAAELEGATVTLSNIGTMGVLIGTPFVIPGQMAILAAGTVQENSGNEAGRRLIRLRLAFDHRPVNGSHAAQFLRSICDELERM